MSARQNSRKIAIEINAIQCWRLFQCATVIPRLTLCGCKHAGMERISGYGSASSSDTIWSLGIFALCQFLLDICFCL